MKDSLRVAVAAAMVTLIAAGGAGCDRDLRVTTSSSTLRVAIGSAPDSLDPRFASGAIGVRMSQLLAPPLCAIDDTLQPKLVLADELIVSDDGLTVDIHLRGPAFERPFHPHVEAGDVVFTYRSIMDPQTGSPHRGRLDVVDGVTAVADRHVRMTLKRVHAPVVTDVICGIGILRARDCATEAPCHGGAGHFSFRDDDDGDDDADTFVLRRRPNLSAHADGPALALRVMRDGTARINALLAGDIDVIVGDVAPWDIAPLRAKGMMVSQRPGVGFSYLGLNTRHPLLQSDARRRAIAMAIDVNALIEARLQGAGTRSTGLLPPGHWAKDPRLSPIPFDLEAARALWQSAGEGDGAVDVPAGGGDDVGDGGARPRLRLLTSTDRLRRSVAFAIADMLGDLGVDVDVDVRDWSVVYEAMKEGRFDMVLAKWTPVVEPDLLHLVLHSSSIPSPGKAGGNRGAFVDVDIDAWLDAARASTNTAERARLYGLVEARVQARVPFVPLWCDDEIVASRSGVLGIRNARTGSFESLVTAAHQDPQGPR